MINSGLLFWDTLYKCNSYVRLSSSIGEHIQMCRN